MIKKLIFIYLIRGKDQIKMWSFFFIYRCIRNSSQVIYLPLTWLTTICQDCSWLFLCLDHQSHFSVLHLFNRTREKQPLCIILFICTIRYFFIFRRESTFVLCIVMGNYNIFTTRKEVAAM